jgi:cytochrome P450
LKPVSAPEVNFFDRDTNDCPYDAYSVLRDQAPVWKDPLTGMYVVTRYEDVREILADTERFSNQVSGAATFSKDVIEPEDSERAEALLKAMEEDREIQRLYEQEGWPPVPTMDALDDPQHFQLRRAFEAPFRPAGITALEPYLEALADRLVDSFIDRGHCEFVSEFAVPLPLFAIGRQMGLSEEDMLRIKPWTDAFVKRLGLMQTTEERLWSAQQEIQFQHFFKPIYDRLRREPDGSLLSELVNKEIPEWGRSLSDAELHSELMIDFMVGGAETTTNALSGGIVLLLRDPTIHQRLISDVESRLPTFIEEVLRLESPVQSLLRQNIVAMELRGVSIPAGSVINLRYSAANRDERQFACPDSVNLDRRRPRSHLAFGAGAHHCLGAPLARRELHYGFKAILERLEDLRFTSGAENLSYQPNYFLRSLNELHIQFTARRRLDS